jgi:hypothetical protein
LTLQDLGAIGELVGGLAVIVTVIYLAIQIRHGIKGYQSTAILESTSHFSNLQLEIAKFDNLLEPWSKAERREPLDALEQRRVIQIVSSYLIGFENMFSQYQNHMMENTAYDVRRVVMASFMTYTGVYDWWQTMGRVQFPPDFVADIEQAIIDFNITLPSEPTP